MTEKEIGTRIYTRRKALGLTLQDIADRVHVARSTIQRYEAGTINQMKMPVLHSIAQALSVNPDWLVGKSENMDSPLPANMIPMPKPGTVPLIGAIACGSPILAEENIEEYVDLPKHIRADFALTCRGDSMIGADIRDGDVVYIRQQPTVRSGQIAAVLIDDEATLKRVYRNGDTVILQPENPTYPPLVFSGTEAAALRIIGLAVAFTHALVP